MLHKQEVDADHLTLDEACRLMFPEYPDVINVVQMCEMLGIGKKAAYHLLCTNQIGSFKEGKGYRIPKINVIRYLLKH